MIKDDLSKFFITKTEAVEFANGLAKIGQQIYQTGFSVEESLGYQFGTEKKDLFMQLLKDQGVNWQDNGALSKYLVETQEKIMKMPTLTLKLAFVPKTKNLMGIADWLSLNTSRQVVVEIEVERELMGGAVINFLGKFCDGSIKAKFREAAYGSNLH